MASCELAVMTASLRRGSHQLHTGRLHTASPRTIPALIKRTLSVSLSSHRDCSALLAAISSMPGVASAGFNSSCATRCMPPPVNTATSPILLSSPGSCAVVSLSCTLQGLLPHALLRVRQQHARDLYRNRTATASFAKVDRHYCRVACICVSSYSRTGDARQSD